MSFWKSLFGSSQPKTPPAAEPVAYNGFMIRAEPYPSEGQYQTAGTIEKEIGGVIKQHRFIRADRHPGLEQAVSFTIDKARQIIDLQGDRIFD